MGVDQQCDPALILGPDVEDLSDTIDAEIMATDKRCLEELYHGVCPLALLAHHGFHANDFTRDSAERFTACVYTSVT